MTFQVKDFLSVVASLVNVTRIVQNKVTDFNVGSVSRSIHEATASEIDALYQQMAAGLRAAIPVSVFNSFNFPPMAAAPASGMVRVTIQANANPVPIASNTRGTREDGAATYVTATDVLIAAGDTFVDVRLVADVPGAAGNLSAGTTFTLSPAPTGFVSAVALADFTNGAEAETLEDQKNRFNTFIASLARGTIAAIRYGLSTAVLKDSAGNVIERVAYSGIVEPWLTDQNQPIALVNVFIHNGVGLTSNDLVAEAVKIIHGYYQTDGTAVPGWKAAGVKVTVQVAPELLVPVGGVVTVAPGFDNVVVLAAVQTALSNYIAQRNIGEKVIRAELIAAAMGVDGVTNFKIAFPADDVTPTSQQKPMPGAFTLTAAALILNPPGKASTVAFGSPTVTA